ncbi:MAG TPA: hypothetical protein P5260_19195, partial [Candidatus Competibacter sp.]|nr:hypothetical protein [Candidatus Competibacter sp.]
RRKFNQGAHVDEEHDFRALQKIWPADNYTLTVATQTLFYEWKGGSGCSVWNHRWFKRYRA